LEDLNFPADSVYVADLMRAMCLARQARKKEAVALWRRNSDQSTTYFQYSAADGDVGIDGLPFEYDDVFVEERVEVSTLDGVTERRTSDEAIHRRLPILLESHDELDIVRLTFRESLDACVPEVNEQPRPPSAFVDDQVRAVVLASRSDLVGNEVAGADRPLLVNLQGSVVAGPRINVHEVVVQTHRC
jgi:hypothetical protein